MEVSNANFSRSNPCSLIQAHHFDGVLSGFRTCCGMSYRVFQHFRLLSHFRKLTSHRFPLAIHNVPLPSHLLPLAPHLVGLTAIDQQSEEHHNQLQDCDRSENPCKYLYPPLYMYVLCFAVAIGLVSAGGWLTCSWRWKLGRRLGWLLGATGVYGGGCVLSTLAFANPFFLWTLQ